ncbi:MAG: long-chain fatty acid--CoA ligase [Lewinellaceae bacterium]|nr:long-chain fatty acid--CoA ligase [Lewinellaceae bacterium]
MDFVNIFGILDYQQKRYPQNIALAGRAAGVWHTWSTGQILAERERISAGLLHRGYRKGDRIGILTHCGSPEWVIADTAMMQIGVVSVPIHMTARPDEITHIVGNSGMKACFVSNDAMLNKLRSTGAELESFFFLAPTSLPDGNVISWNDLARDPEERDREKIRYITEGIQPDDLATLLYTSGTTGQPKGVMLTHANIVSNIKSVLAIVPVGPDVTAVSFLPMSHIFERMVTYVYLAAGTPVWYVDALEHLPGILTEVKPHFFTAVPRILERMYERLLEERNRSGILSRKIMDWAIRLGERYPYSGERGIPADYFIKRLLADLLVFRHWRKKMGGRIRYIAVGAAALQPRLGRLFSAAGIDVREGYGLTETSPVIAFNRFEPGGVHFGTVGIPAPGVEVRIGEPDEQGEGEIEVKGPNVMTGYYTLPDETAARFTTDGWFKTGDLGKFAFKRFLMITGRKSEVFKTTSGKFVAPAFVEQQLMASPLISQVMALGLNQPFVAALIVPNFPFLENWCIENKVHWTSPQFMVLNPKVEKLFRLEIAHLNEERLGPVEKVRAFHLLHEPWTSENGLLTPTLKLRRDVLSRQFQAEIAQLFDRKMDAAGDPDGEAA